MVTIAPPVSATTSTATAVRLDALHKTYGSVRAVAGLDLVIGVGEIVAVLGPNGAGKSTTNELILGLVSPDQGRVEVLGGDPLVAVRDGRVGAMLQGGALLAEARVRDVLTLMHGLHAHPMPIAEVVERADLSGFLRTRTDKLSGGQAQRLRYALALLPDPELLILDEPTVGMDVEVRRRFWASMTDFVASGRTVIFATHYLEEADEIADRVVVLAAGRVVADGTGAEIKSRVVGRTLTLAAPDDGGPSARDLQRLPGVNAVELRGARWSVHSADSDATVRALLSEWPHTRDLEIVSARLEDAFLQLTATHDQEQA